MTHCNFLGILPDMKSPEGRSQHPFDMTEFNELGARSTEVSNYVEEKF